MRLFYLCGDKGVIKMRIMSMDQSTKKSGWAIFDESQYVCSGVVDKTKSELDTYERSFDMAKDLWKIIAKYKPERLVIEDVQNQQNTNTVIVLSRLQGMIIGYAEAHGIQTYILLPSQWRKALSYHQGPKVKREELKQQSLDYVKEHFGLDVCEDQAEAICINYAAHKIYNFEDDLWGE